MNSGRYILEQVLDLVHWQTLSRLSERFHAEARVIPLIEILSATLHHGRQMSQQNSL
jgi:hypothetical protein